MIRVKLTGHEYRYDIFLILTLFYDKSEINFVDDGDFEFETVLDSKNSVVQFNILKNQSLFLTEKVSGNLNDKKFIKNAIKMTALRCLEKYTGVNIPWGILVGIRPTKIVHECLKNGFSNDEVISYLISNYSLAQEKANLTLEVALNEAKFLVKPQKSVSIYVGIPFCPTRCVYCSFTSNPIGGNKGLVELYLEALFKEINTSLKHLNSREFKVDTLYIGGGTPTSLTSAQMEQLLDTISSNVDIKYLREFTVEAGRPDSIDKDKLKVIRDSGCSRISINPQTMNDETLKRIGRLHTSKEIIDKYYLARELGFDNINMDMIIGLPGEGIDEIQKSSRIISELSPDNITIHTMAIKRASILNEKEYSRENTVAEKMYEIASRSVRNIGMYPYYMYRQKNMVSPLENVGYCKKDKECIYNIQMIAENIPIVSMGADAVSKIVFEKENRLERVANLKDVREYVNRIDEMIDNKIKAIDSLE